MHSSPGLPDTGPTLPTSLLNGTSLPYAFHTALEDVAFSKQLTDLL